MPNNEEHAQHTYRLYRIWANDLHEWIDAPSKTHGQGHRRFRHSPHRPPPLSAIEKYGYDMARKIQLAHFKLDRVHWGAAPELPIWQEGNWIFKRMPNGRTYKKQLNGKTKSPKQFRSTRRRTHRRSSVSSSIVVIEGFSMSLSITPQPPKTKASSKWDSLAIYHQNHIIRQRMEEN